MKLDNQGSSNDTPHEIIRLRKNINSLTEIIGYVMVISDDYIKALRLRQQKLYSEATWLKLLIVERLYFNIYGVKELLKSYLSNSKIIIPISIIMRVMVLDLLLYYYITKIVRDLKDDNRIHNKVVSILADQLRYIISDLNSKKSMTHITQEEYDSELDKLRSLYPKYFNADGDLINYEVIPASKIYKVLSSDAKYEDRIKFYNYYNFFSRIEHIGVVTQDYQNLAAHDTEFQLKVLYEPMIFFFTGLIDIFGDEPISLDTNKIQEIDRLLKDLHEQNTTQSNGNT